MRSTHTFSILHVSKRTWDEIAEGLRAADYDHAFLDDAQTVDLHGIAIRPFAPPGMAGPKSDGDIAIELLRRLQTPGESAQARYEAAEFLKRVRKGIK